MRSFYILGYEAHLVAEFGLNLQLLKKVSYFLIEVIYLQKLRVILVKAKKNNLVNLFLVGLFMVKCI